MNSIGYIDQVHPTKIVGWAAVEIAKGQYIRSSVKFLIDGQICFHVRASRYRQDLVEHGVRPGNFGFEIYLPPKYADDNDGAPRRVEIKGHADVDLIGGSIYIVGGAFKTSSPNRSTLSFASMCGTLSFDSIERTALVLYREKGSLAALYYIVGILLSRSPKRSEIDKLDVIQFDAQRWIDAIMQSDEFRLRLSID